MIREDISICDCCKNPIHKKDNVAYTDNGTFIIGDFCICEFCYLNLRKAW